MANPTPIPQAVGAAAVPEGWKLVPIQPTMAMLEAAYKAFQIAAPSLIGFNAKERAYKALLQHAPEPASTSAPAEPTGESTGAAPDERKLIGALQSLLDRMANDPRTGLMFEADGDTLRDAMTFVRRTARAHAFAAPPSGERPSAPAPEGSQQ